MFYIVTSNLPGGAKFKERGNAITEARKKAGDTKRQMYVLEVIGVAQLQDVPTEFVPVSTPELMDDEDDPEDND